MGNFHHPRLHVFASAVQWRGGRVNHHGIVAVFANKVLIGRIEISPVFG